MATSTTTRTDPDAGAVLLVFENVCWPDYEAMLRIVGESHVRVSYDEGRMEVMSPSYEHESDAYLLGRVVDTLTEEWGIPVEGGDTTTFQREDLGKGAEADKCYFLGDKSARVRGKKRLDLSVDPPPDLVIEVDITSSSLDKLAIYGALGIPEVWRFDGEMLQFLHRQEDGRYHARDTSRNFPALTVAEVAQTLERAAEVDKTTWVGEFRAFVRNHRAAHGRERNGGT